MRDRPIAKSRSLKRRRLLSASQSAQRLSPARNRKFCRLPAGAEWIRTSGSAREWLPFCFVYLPETVRVSPKGLVRDRGFESTSLQQTVRLSSGFASIRGQSPGFQPLCGPFRAAVVGRDAQSPAASGRAALVSLSGPIPVPQCCGCGSRYRRRWPRAKSVASGAVISAER